MAVVTIDLIHPDESEKEQKKAATTEEKVRKTPRRDRQVRKQVITVDGEIVPAY